MRRWWYVLIGPLTLGMLAWVAFLFLGIRARKPLWLAFAAIYLAITIATGILVEIESEDENLSGSIIIALMGGSGAHALALRRPYEERMELLEDPEIDAAEDRVERQDLAREIARDDPGRARRMGIGRPDRDRAFHGGLVDVNGAPAEWIARVAGIPRESADLITAGRPYTSVEDMDLVVNLPPDQLAKLRDVAVFLPPT